MLSDPSEICLITGQYGQDKKRFLTYLEASLKRGIKLVQIRAKHLSLVDYSDLAAAGVDLCHRYHAKVLLNEHIELLAITQADGVHLPSRQLMTLTQRPVSTDSLLSVACHTADEVQQAMRIEADFILISPVLATTSCPSAKPLGWQAFSMLAKQTYIPVYALGGMTTDHIIIAKSYGARGIAAIRSVWRCV